MHKRYIAIVGIAALFMLAACGEKPNQNAYSEDELGVGRAMEYATVSHVREIDIVAKNTGNGALLGAGVAGGAASYAGGGSGKTWATVGGALVGAVAGTLAERELSDRKGLEYTLVTVSGETKTIAQEIGETDVRFAVGDRVMFQNCQAGKYYQRCKKDSYQRVLPVDHWPSK